MIRYGVGSILLIASLLLAGCHKDAPWKANSFETTDLSRSAQDVQLPAALWNKIAALLKEEDAELQARAYPKDEDEEQAKAREEAESTVPTTLPTEFAPLKVYLIEKNRGVLGKRNHELEFSSGGGAIDLQDFVQPLQGSFYFLVDFLPELKGIKRRVFFLSNSVLRKKGREIIGSGCRTYFDISKAFEKAVRDEGFLVNTTDNRHVSALAGVYFFAAVHEGKLHLASLTVKDSGQLSLQCRR